MMEHTSPRLATLRARYPSILSACRGKGLLVGLEFPSDAVGYECAAALFRRGVLVAGTYSKARTSRIDPALDIPTPLLLGVLATLASHHSRRPQWPPRNPLRLRGREVLIGSPVGLAEIVRELGARAAETVLKRPLFCTDFIGPCRLACVGA